MKSKEIYSLLVDIGEPSSILVSVIPSSGARGYGGRKTDGSYKIFLQSSPENGKANAELLLFLKKETGVSWDIVSGHTSRKKLCRRGD